MAHCAPPDGSAVQEGFGESIEPPNSVDDIQSFEESISDDI